jgi:hypothetical protein
MAVVSSGSFKDDCRPSKGEADDAAGPHYAWGWGKSRQRNVNKTFCVCFLPQDVGIFLQAWLISLAAMAALRQGLLLRLSIRRVQGVSQGQ